MLSTLDRLALAIVVMVAVALCGPFARHHWFDSHEGFAYVLRVVEFGAALRSGDLYPRWAADFYGGYGSPFFVFYAPLVFAGSSLLAIPLGSAVAGLKAWIVLMSVAAGVGTYAVVRAETSRPDAALLASLLYLAGPYRITNVYVRGDIAEYTAISCLPWAIWAYRSLARDPGLRAGVSWGLLAIASHAAVVFSHAILGLWGTFVLFLMNVVTSHQLWQRSARRHLGLLWAAFFFSLGVSVAYTGPALVQKHYVQIGIMNAGYTDPSLQLLSLQELVSAGQFCLVPSVAAALVLGVAALAWRSRSWLGLAWALGAAFCAFLSTRYAERFWDLRLPLTTYIQFPWRLHGLANLASALAIGFAWASLFRRGSWREAAALALGSAAVLAALPLVAFGKPFAEGSFPETTEAIRRGIHHTTGHEYLPVAVREPPRRPADAVATSNRVVEVRSSFSEGTTHEVEVDVSQPGALVLKLHMFPGWGVRTLQGPATAVLGTGENGLGKLTFPSPGRYLVEVSFGSSPLRAACGGFSMLALLAAWPSLRWLARRRWRARAASDEVAVPHPMGSTTRSLA